jgi:hypothetical protein
VAAAGTAVVRRVAVVVVVALRAVAAGVGRTRTIRALVVVGSTVAVVAASTVVGVAAAASTVEAVAATVAEAVVVGTTGRNSSAMKKGRCRNQAPPLFRSGRRVLHPEHE